MLVKLTKATKNQADIQIFFIRQQGLAFYPPEPSPGVPGELVGVVVGVSVEDGVGVEVGGKVEVGVGVGSWVGVRVGVEEGCGVKVGVGV